MRVLLHSFILVGLALLAGYAAAAQDPVPTAPPRAEAPQRA